MSQPSISQFKRQYTREDIAEIKDWFQRHEAELPVTLELNEATRYNNLKQTIAAYFEVYGIHGDNPTFSGQIHQLFLIRQRLIEQGITD